MLARHNIESPSSWVQGGTVSSAWGGPSKIQFPAESFSVLSYKGMREKSFSVVDASRNTRGSRPGTDKQQYCALCDNDPLLSASSRDDNNKYRASKL